ncbi:MAG TPA: DUF6056 family protein [Kofleriaceae bacterium]|nr:DUF6056 family protein [Kofleriaceae bacterium]
MPRVLRLLFVTYVVATAAHIGYVVAHEPFAFDAWNVAQDTHAQPFSIGRFFDYGLFEYTHSNPRLGQWFTYLAYKLELFAVIATPLVYLSLALAAFVLGTGRRPSWKRGRDLALLSIAIGFGWLAMPRIGMIMFCRAYSANYLYCAAIQLWFLVPLRLSRQGTASVPVCVAYFVLGLLAGMCNEHTGPALCLFTLGYVAWWHRRLDDRPNLLWAGALGTVVGFAAIFFAPGQFHRYDGLAQKASGGMFGRLVQRVFAANLDILIGFVNAAAPLLAALVVAIAVGKIQGLDDETRPLRRRTYVLLALALGAATLITLTVYVSPKTGPRFYLHGMALLLAAFIGVADVTLTTSRRLVGFVVFAVVASGYAAARTIPLYQRLDEQSDERLAALDATPPGSVFTADSYDQVEDTWWFLGDDFRDVKKRELIATYFNLKGVIFRAVDLDAPLGVSDVKLVPRYDLQPASCLDEVGGLELGKVRAFDTQALDKAIASAIDVLRDRIGTTGTLSRLDVAVQFTGAKPKLPRDTLVVAKWQPDRFEAYTATIQRDGHSKTRQVILPKDMPAGFEYYIYPVGGEASHLGPELEYEPTKRGAYWVLACRPAECFVIAAARHI